MSSMNRNKYLIIALLVFVCSVATFAGSMRPLDGVTILLDPGHGGADPGAVGPTGLKESEVNLRVARYLRDLLESDGARVEMVRETDEFLSLSRRVEMSAHLKPDLFLSIHHNASLQPIKQNKSEVYYKANDVGISRIVAENIRRQFLLHGFGRESDLIPGGFFVLRNNPAPSVLTEASYMTLPEIEQQLRTGRSLTNQAQALRLAIRDAFKHGVFNVTIFASKNLTVNTEYLNLVFSADEKIDKIRTRMSVARDIGFDFAPVTSFGQNNYRFFNTTPLSSGIYDLSLTFYSQSGRISRTRNISIEVALPFENSIVQTYSEFIPEGFRGRFPFMAKLKDRLGRPNRREVDLELYIDGRRSGVGSTDSQGTALIYAELSGFESGSVVAVLKHDGRQIAQSEIKIKKPSSRFVLGRINDVNGNGVSGAKVTWGTKSHVTSGPGGLFYLSYPMSFNNLQLFIRPPLGYSSKSTWIRTAGEPVVIKDFRIDMVSESLMGKKIGIISPLAFDNMLRPLVRKFMAAGASVHRLNFPEGRKNAVHQAVLEANLIPGLNYLLSFKTEDTEVLRLRHYHLRGSGYRLAKQIAESAKDDLAVLYGPGSDYEINHSGAVALVTVLPPAQDLAEMFENLSKHIYKAMSD